MGDTVLSVSSRALLSACDELGLDTQSMLDAAGVDRAIVEDPDGRLNVAHQRSLWAKAFELSGDPDLALHAAEALPFGAYKVIDFLASNAPTIGASLSSVSRYFPLINTAVVLPVEVGEDVASLGAAATGDGSVLSRAYVEYTFAAIFLRTRFATGRNYPLLLVEFAQPKPDSVAEHERIFGCPVRFDAPSCRMSISRSVWDAPLGDAVPTLFQVLDEHAELLLGRLPARGGLSTDVRAAVAKELRGGDTGLDHVARKLGMSGRTLQRRLGECGESFSEIVDELRHAMALTYLAERDIAIGEVAYLLGFGSQSSFTKAFRRWTGRAPSSYRRRE